MGGKLKRCGSVFLFICLENKGLKYFFDFITNFQINVHYP